MLHAYMFNTCCCVHAESTTDLESISSFAEVFVYMFVLCRSKFSVVQSAFVVTINFLHAVECFFKNRSHLFQVQMRNVHRPQQGSATNSSNLGLYPYRCCLQRLKSYPHASYARSPAEHVQVEVHCTAVRFWSVRRSQGGYCTCPTESRYSVRTITLLDYFYTPEHNRCRFASETL